MIALLTALLGFAAPFLPDLIRIMGAKVANAHELAMLDRHIAAAREMAVLRHDEIRMASEVADLQSARQAPTPSFGIQLLDVASRQGTPWRPILWAGFTAFLIVDWLNALVRPAITFWLFGLYGLVKFASYRIALTVHGDAATAALNMWTAEDATMLAGVLAFWFGARHRERVLGKAEVAR